MATLGIDFGTKYTFIIKYDADTDQFTRIGDNKFYSFKKGVDISADQMKALGIRTAIGLDNEEHWIVGIQEINRAKEKGTLIEDNICWNIKTMLRKDVDEEPGNSHHNFEIKGENIKKTALELAKNFFGCILCDKKILNDIDYIVCGIPGADFAGEKTDAQRYRYNLNRVLNEAIVPLLGNNFNENHILIIDEPTLAGIAYFMKNDKKLHENDVILVIDIGGGTSDFSIIKVNNKKTGTHVSISREYSAGNVAPAGEAFDEEIKKKVEELRTCNDEEIKKKVEELLHTRDNEEYFSFVKDRIFLTKNSFTIEFLKNKYLEKFGAPVENEFVLKSYNECARRAKIKEKIKIVYNCDHCKGLSWYSESTDFGEKWDDNDNKIISIEAEFKELYKDVAGKVGEFLKQDACKKHIDSINTIFFVGGTCNIKELREQISNTVINLKPNKTTINEVFIEEENETGKVPLTCSNAVALGAAYYANCYATGVSNIKNALAVPKIWIKYSEVNKRKIKKTSVCLLSQSFKNKGTDNYDDIYLPLKLKIKKKDVDEKNFFHFTIESLVAGRRIVYPQPYDNVYKGKPKQVQPTFAYRVQIDDKHKYEEIYVFADIMNSGEVVIFICPTCNGSNIPKIYGYKYVFLDKDTDSKITISDNPYFPEIPMQVLDNGRCKKYTFYSDSHTKKLYEGINFNINPEKKAKSNMSKECDNQLYGWFLLNKN